MKKKTWIVVISIVLAVTAIVVPVSIFTNCQHQTTSSSTSSSTEPETTTTTIPPSYMAEEYIRKSLAAHTYHLQVAEANGVSEMYLYVEGDNLTLAMPF